MNIALLGSGFIARFYAESLHAQRRTDRIVTVYSRNQKNAERFAKDYNLPHHTDNMQGAINYNGVDVVLIALPNHLHEPAVRACAEAKKWEPVALEDWRGDTADSYEKEFTLYDDNHYLIKEEVLPNGDIKLILKHESTGEIFQKTKFQ